MGKPVTPAQYEIIKTLHQGPWFEVLQAVEQGSGEPVVLKRLRKEQVSPAAVNLMAHEYKISQRFDDSRLIRYQRLESLGGQPTLISDDFGGLSLESQGPLSKFSDSDVLWIACEATKALREIHKSHRVYLNLDLNHLVFNPATGVVRLVNLSQMMDHRETEQQVPTVELHDSRYEFLSPEAAGLSHRPLDYRSDLYSLGVLLAWLFTGKSPFDGLEPIERMHAKMTAGHSPKASGEIDVDVQRIVAKLMEVGPEKRYQSAQGVLVDLKKLHNEPQGFELGLGDQQVELKFSQGFYGLQRDLKKIGSLINEIGQGARGLLWLHGEPGSGKSRLLHHVCARKLPLKSLVLKANFYDRKGLGLSPGWRELLKPLFLPLLLQTKDYQEQFKQNLQASLGESLGVLSPFYPDFEALLGPVAQQSPTGSLAKALCQVFSFAAQFYSPVVLSLDDVEHASPADLELIADLLESLPPGVLVILACARPLSQLASPPPSISYKRIELKSLPAVHLQSFLSDSLGMKGPQTNQLSKQLLSNGAGTFFKVQEVLEQMVSTERLVYEDLSGWVLKAKVPCGLVPKNLQQGLVRKVSRLPDASRSLLQQMAVFDGPCGLDELSLLSSTPLTKLYEQLEPAVDLGLVSLKESALSWVHLDLKHAILEQLPSRWSGTLHLNLSSIVRFFWGQKGSLIDLFECLNYLLSSVDLLKTEKEILDVVGLVRDAGDGCAKAGLDQAAHRCFAQGLQLIQGLPAEVRAPLDLELNKRQVCLWMDQNRTFEAQQTLTQLIRAHEGANKVEFLYLQIQLKIRQENRSSVAEELSQGLMALGIDENPQNIKALPPQTRRLAIRLIESCLLPLLEHAEPVMLAAVRLLERLALEESEEDLAQLAQVFLAAQMAAGGQPLGALERVPLESTKEVEHLGIYPLISTLVHTALVRPYFESFEVCAANLKPLIKRLVTQNPEWAVQGIMWFFDLSWMSPKGPKELKALIIELATINPSFPAKLPVGIEDCFLSESPKSGRFRVPLMEAMIAYLEGDSAGAYTKLSEAKTVKPWVSPLNTEGLLLFLAGSLGLSNSRSKDLLSQQSIHLIEDLTAHNPAALSAPMHLLIAERNAKQSSPSIGVRGYEEAQEEVGSSNQVFYQLALSEMLASVSWKDQHPQKTKFTLLGGIQLAEQWGLEPVIRLFQQKLASYFPTDGVPKTATAQVALLPDQDTLITGLQEISQEVDSKQLAIKLLQIVLRQTGAHKGMIFFHPFNASEAEPPTVVGQVGEMKISPVQPGKDYPDGITDFVSRACQDIVLAQAHLRGPFVTDPYIQRNQVRSVLCLNLVQHNKNFGLLYLENNRVEGAFVETRLEPLKVLIRQAWIAWENAQLYEQKTKMVDRLKELDRLKDEFLANTSHELRTPLAGIIGLTEMALNTENPGQTKEPLKLVVQSAKRLNQLVNDLLDFSLIKENRLLVKPSAVDLFSVVENILGLCRPMCGSRPLLLANQIPKDLPPVFADQNRLQQILYNLIGNAIKFCPSGSVVVSAEEAGSEVQVSVSDTGVGIDPARIEDLFEPFVRGSEGTLSTEGTGLGLALTKRLIELHHGSLVIASTPGEGSEFTFDLPISQETVTASADSTSVYTGLQTLNERELRFPPQPRKPDAKVLVVEDDPIILKTLLHYLTKAGYGYLFAENGQEATKQISQNPDIDLVLLDVMLPDSNGFELTQQIRQNKGRADLPVILLTARGEMEDVLTGFQAGANDYMVKPMAAEELLARVGAHVESKKSHERLRQNRRLQQEVHRRQLDEEALKTKQKVLLQFFDQLDNAVFSIDSNRCIKLTNQHADLLFRAGAKRFIGRRLSQVLPLIDNQVTEAIESGKESLKFTLPIGSDTATDWELFLLPLGAERGWLIHLFSAGTRGLIRPVLDSLSEEPVASGGATLQAARQTLGASKGNSAELSAEKRLEMVELMVFSVRYWTQTTGKTKVDFAGESGIWRVNCEEGGTYRARTLDRYLNLNRFPKKPRRAEVLQTAYYVLQNCPDQAIELKRQIEERVARIEDWLLTQ